MEEENLSAMYLWSIVTGVPPLLDPVFTSLFDSYVLVSCSYVSWVSFGLSS